MLNYSHGGAVSARTIQPYFVLSTGSAYYKKVMHDSPISHFYSFVADKSDGAAFAVPDASVDVLFLCDKDSPKVRLCGSTTQAQLVEIQSGKRYFGARFRSGYIPKFIDMDSKCLVDAEFSLSDIDRGGDALLEKIISSKSFEEQVQFFMQHYQHRIDCSASPFSLQIRDMISQGKGDIRISQLEQYTGYSSRYINKIFAEHFGLSPKSYALIVRFQHVLQCLTSHQNLSLTSLALEQGYADQSHFLREFKKFAAQAPSKFIQAIEESEYQNRLHINNDLSITGLI